MKEEKGKKVYCTNMQEDDPVIEKFMKEYLQEKTEAEQEGEVEDIVVNFDISYPDGRCEAHTCGSDSYLFGGEDKSCINSKIEAEEMKCYYSDADIEKMNKEYPPEEKYPQEEKYHEEKVYEDNKKEMELCEEPKESESYGFECDYYDEDEKEKWINCEDEWIENKNDHCDKIDECKCKREVKGSITVYSTLCSKEGTRIKGLKINLYRLNGICPKLVDSKVTDCDGKIMFCDVPEGAYRVIQLIDKNYFEKPQYINWNEVTIDECTTETTIYAINRIINKRQCRK